MSAVIINTFLSTCLHCSHRSHYHVPSVDQIFQFMNYWDTQTYYVSRRIFKNATFYISPQKKLQYTSVLSNSFTTRFFKPEYICWTCTTF